MLCIWGGPSSSDPYFFPSELIIFQCMVRLLSRRLAHANSRYQHWDRDINDKQAVEMHTLQPEDQNCKCPLEHTLEGGKIVPHRHRTALPLPSFISLSQCRSSRMTP
jgi:hypothetical protein